MLLLGLFLAQTLLDAAVPRELVQRATTTPWVPALAAEVCDAWSRDKSSHQADEATPLFYLRMIDRWQDRVRFARHLMPALRHPVSLIRRYRYDLLQLLRIQTTSER
jgi:hypothetical protein